MIFITQQIRSLLPHVCMALVLIASPLCASEPPHRSLPAMLRRPETIIGASMTGILLAPRVINFLKPVQQVGVISIEGVMKESAKTVKELQTFFKNPRIKAIVLRINSGGGAPGTAQAIYHVIRTLKKAHNKPVIAWVENVAASGAYYAACAADVIIASPSAMIGSVGVIAQVWQLKGVLNNFNVTKETITSGDYKAWSDSSNTMTAEQKAMLQEICDRTYKRFITDVQTSRPKLSELPIEEWANGRVFDAEYSLELGMVDLLGSQITVEQTLKDATHDERNISFVYPAPTPFFVSYLDKQKLAVSMIADELWNRFEQLSNSSMRLIA